MLSTLTRCMRLTRLRRYAPDPRQNLSGFVSTQGVEDSSWIVPFSSKLDWEIHLHDLHVTCSPRPMNVGHL